MADDGRGHARTARARRRALPLAALLAAACAPPTQTIVFVEAAPSRAAEASTLRVRVWNTEGALVRDQSIPASDPARVPLEPNLADASRTYRLAAELVGDDGCVTGRVVADGVYARDRRRAIRLRFDEACAGVVCPNHQACFEGTCRGTCFPLQPLDDTARSTPMVCASGDAGVPGGPEVLTVEAADLGGGTVAFRWTLDRPANGQVELGDSLTYGELSIFEPSYLDRHNQQLRQPLEVGRAYHYRVHSVDESGGEVYSLERCFVLE